MSAFAFLTKMTIHEAGDIGNHLVGAVVNFDPETASKVDIDNQEAHCHELSVRLAEAVQTEKNDHVAMDAILVHLNESKAGAKVIGGQLKAAQDAGNTALVSKLETGLNTVMNQIETMGGAEMDGSISGTYFDAVQKHARSEQKMHEWEQTHAGAVANWTAARDSLAKAQTAMQEAKDQEQQAIQEKVQAERDAGLKAKGDNLNVALDAMTKAAEERTIRARAAIQDAQAIKESTGANADDIVKAAMAEAAKASAPSALDRLAKLG